MRTTLTLDDDLFAQARKSAAKSGQSLKETINSAIRLGLEQMLKPAPSKAYRTEARPLGLMAGYSYDNIAELLAVAEGEDHK